MPIREEYDLIKFDRRRLYTLQGWVDQFELEVDWQRAKVEAGIS